MLGCVLPVFSDIHNLEAELSATSIAFPCNNKRITITTTNMFILHSRRVALVCAPLFGLDAWRLLLRPLLRRSYRHATALVAAASKGSRPEGRIAAAGR